LKGVHRENNRHRIGNMLQLCEEHLLIDLLDRDTSRPLNDYKDWLEFHTGKQVSISMLCHWFKNRYKHKATLKFKPNNILRFIEFMGKKETLPLHG
jgi:hypothetical protein